MAEFKPYSVTRGGFATPRELYMSVVKDLTQFYRDGDNAFTIAYPTDISDLDYTDSNSAKNDVVIVQATDMVDPCTTDPRAKQPWVIRLDTRTSIGHGIGHINITTPLQIDWSKPKAPAIPYIPPNVPYEPNSIYTEGTLGFVGMRVPDGDGAVAKSNERGFINRAVYHTNVTQVQQVDEFGNAMWELIPVNGESKPIPVNGSRRREPLPGLDELGYSSYKTELTWYELLNPDQIDTSATYGPVRHTDEMEALNTAYKVDGIALATYKEHRCTLHFKAYPGQTSGDMKASQQSFVTTKVEGSLPQFLAETAESDSPRDDSGVPQQVTFIFNGRYSGLTGYIFKVKRSGYRTYDPWNGQWSVNAATSAKWALTEAAITDIEGGGLDPENNVGVEVYDNTRFDLVAVANNAFDALGAAKDPREGALNVPMSYALTVSDHGITLAVWDQAVDQYETNEGHRFSWVSVQRLVDKDTGAPLVDQSKSFCPLFCMYGVYHEKLASSMYLVVRESDVHRPAEEQLAGEDGPDSNAVLNTFEQIAVSEDYEYVITVPSGLTTQRYLYLEEADLIGYTSADVISNGALSEFQMYDEGVCSVTGIEDEATCLAQGGDWESTTRLYKGLPSTGKYNTGMRVLMRWYGGRLGSESPQV